MEIFAAQNKLPLHPYSAMLCLSTTVMPDAIPLVLPVKVILKKKSKVLTKRL